MRRATTPMAAADSIDFSQNDVDKVIEWARKNLYIHGV